MPYNPEETEKKMLKLWDEKHVFERSVSERAGAPSYVFYDGPPFATGLPHYGHILASTIKDVVPRFWTMRGRYVRRRWGWDCHGLPIENIVENEMNISGKKQIEECGVDSFNSACRSKVLTYATEWGKMVRRIGRFVDFEDSYKTMDSTYMESVWWALKEIWKKGLIYEGRKVLLFCPRCETPISNFEVAMDNSYKDVTEESVMVKFKVIDPAAHSLPENTFIVSWTTTPWTLPGNVALAVGAEIVYVIIQQDDKSYVLAKDRLEVVKGEYALVKEMKGKQLEGIAYEPLFDIPAIGASGKKAHYVATADFVTVADGTGVVHTAVMYGEDDYNFGVRLDLPMVPLLDQQGVFNASAPKMVRGMYFKDAEKIIKKELAARGVLFDKFSYTHSYPFCWRCGTALFYNAIPAWFINIQKIKKELVARNEDISWYPAHLKHGRFLKGLENAPDWNISRNRYWATALPFWRCEANACGHITCVGSLEDLQKRATNYNEVYDSRAIEEVDLHKPYIDKVLVRCEACGGNARRVSEVVDCWVESASMPFAEFHYPFENEKLFKERYPADFVSEYIAQTRAWFYVMHVMGTILFNKAPFLHVVTTGTILNEKGEKLSKSKQNFPDPWHIIERYGVDALRYYLMTSVVMQADNLFFSEREVDGVYKKIVLILSNVVSFYELFASESVVSAAVSVTTSTHVLDKWIIARLHLFIKDATSYMESYDVVHAYRPLEGFVNDMSTWYIRRSRDRFKGSDTEDKAHALATLRYVLVELSKAMAPVMPFFADEIYQKFSGTPRDSVHLEEWPEPQLDLINEEVLADMAYARAIVELGLAARAEAKIKVRQPLLYIQYEGKPLSEALEKIIADELNVESAGRVERVKEAADHVVKMEKNAKISLCVAMTDALKAQGLVREVTRAINQLRKTNGFTIHDRAQVRFATDNTPLREVIEKNAHEIAEGVLADEMVFDAGTQGKPVNIESATIVFEITKI
ncbi:MAG: isoleucine--tRNA ligase [Candidatus Magasanikbacteria bacterium]|nr:isoleucine--tRNA ligase [Candidatus Magasanikbacteria bacterium]